MRITGTITILLIAAGLYFYTCSGRKQAATMVKEWRSFIEISMSESDT